MHACVCECVNMCKLVQCLWKSEECVRFPGVELEGGCERPIVGDGKWAQVLWKNSMNS